MRAFIVFSCLALAAAKPQYNYQPGGSGGLGGGGSLGGGLGGGDLGGGLGGGSLGGGLGGGSLGGGLGGGSLGGGLGGGSLGGGLGGGSLGGGLGGGSLGGGGGGFSGGLGLGLGGGGGGGGGAGGQAVVQKHIYVHVAPQDPEDLAGRNAPAVRHQKNYRIVFIKAPSGPSLSEQLAARQQINEEKTLVYVLVKKPESAEEIQQSLPAPPQPSKPEVYFIKYKTQKENVGGAPAPIGLPAPAPGPIGLPAPGPGVISNDVSPGSGISGLPAPSPVYGPGH